MGKLNILWDDYQVYKGVKLYPFLMSDYDLFEELISILLFNKNQVPDPKIIKMSYLRFLIYVLPCIIDENQKQIYPDILTKFQKLFKYILKEQDFKLIVDNDEKIFLYVKLGEEFILLNEYDFDKIKTIILNQNAIPIIDNKLHPDLQKELQENMEFLAKKQGYLEGNIEDQIISYKCKMQFESYKPIKEMTIYQFRRELARLDLITDYQIYKTAESSGMVTFKKPIPHWRSHISDEPDYSSLLMNKREFDVKMNQIAKGK